MREHSSATTTLTLSVSRRSLLAAARSRIWRHLRQAARATASGLTRRALAANDSARAQEMEYPAIDLADIARGEEGYIVRREGEPGWDYSHLVVASAGDWNGDGLGDLIIGAPYSAPGGEYRAGVGYLSDAVTTLGYLFLGSAEPPAPGPVTCGVDPT